MTSRHRGSGVPPWNDTRPAPNGQSVQDNFKAWFGASLAVDDAGMPLRLLHGTNQAIALFDTARQGESTASVSSRLGFWFTDCPLVANDYAMLAARQVIQDIEAFERKTARLLREMDRAERLRDWSRAESLCIELEAHDLEGRNDFLGGANIMAVHLRMERPAVADMGGGFMATGNGLEIVERARAEGCDGVIFRRVNDSPTLSVVSDHYVVFDARQIKSAFGNSGLYLRDSASLTDSQADLELERVSRAREAAFVNPHTLQRQGRSGLMT